MPSVRAALLSGLYGKQPEFDEEDMKIVKRGLQLPVQFGIIR